MPAEGVCCTSSDKPTKLSAAQFAGLSLALWTWVASAAAHAQPPARPGQSSGKASATPTAAALPPTFTHRDAEGFHFAAQQIEGTIRLDGAYHGVTRLVDKRTGRQVIDPRYSALNLFKVMSVNLAMGQPRTGERSVQITPHGLEVKWAPTEMHRAELTALYQVHPPNAVDVTVTVRSRVAYPGYELFMSSYFDKALRPYVYLASQSGNAADLVLPWVHDAFRGTVLVFPRDTHAARRCLDGRWDRSEGPMPTVQMCPVRRYAHSLAVQVDPEGRLGVVLMAPPRQCYAISTRYHADREADRLTTYSAFDLSLFGDDLVPGDQRTAKVRLAVTPLDREFSQAMKLYQEFLGARDEGAAAK